MFDHEKLRVYQEALAFASWAETILDRAKKSSPLHDQLDRARTSILLNIAEGNGRFTAPDRCRFFDTARGSALECAACLDLLAVKKLIDPQESKQGKESLQKIVSMLVGLIRSNSTDRLHDAPVSYRVKPKKDYD
jgi:four helix bundle protein